MEIFFFNAGVFEGKRMEIVLLFYGQKHYQCF